MVRGEGVYNRREWEEGGLNGERVNGEKRRWE